MKFVPIYRGVDTRLALMQVARNEDLFDRVTLRQEFEGSCHRDTQSIMLRSCKALHDYRGGDTPIEQRAAIDAAFDDLEAMDREEYDFLPEIRPLVSSLMASVGGERLGAVVVVKLKPGGEVLAHRDEGVYSEYYDRFHIALASPPGCALVVEGEECRMQAGEAWWFAHKKRHWAYNKSEFDRIHVIVDIKARSRR